MAFGIFIYFVRRSRSKELCEAKHGVGMEKNLGRKNVSKWSADYTVPSVCFTLSPLSPSPYKVDCVKGTEGKTYCPCAKDHWISRGYCSIVFYQWRINSGFIAFCTDWNSTHLWLIRSFIMIVYEKFFSRALDRKSDWIQKIFSQTTIAKGFTN